jgi:hypothetical protein
MADYYPLIARAVTGLDKSTGEARRALYERARTALVTQLRGVEPALSEADITRERLALEEAIRKVEAEAARRPRSETPPPAPEEAPSPEIPPMPPRAERPAPFAPAPASLQRGPADVPPAPNWNELRRELDGLEPSPPERLHAAEQDMGTPDGAPPEQSADEPPLPFETERPEEPPAPPPELPAPPQPPHRPGKRFPGERTSLVDEGLKGFRDVVAETDDLGGATASASKSARDVREAFAALPPSGDAERVEPRFGANRPPEQELPPRKEPRPGERQRPVPRPIPEDFEEEDSEEHPRRGSRGILRKLLGVGLLLVLGALAFLLYREWGTVTGLFQSARAPATQASKEAPQARPKISDRIGGGQQDSAARPAAGATAAVAQRVVLYEQQPNTQERKQYVGSVIWRTETASAGPGQPADVAVKAEVEIPERQIRMSFTMRRNLDPSLPASHTIEILFSTPADFQPGGVADVPGVLMEDTEQSRGAPLTGLRVKVTNGFFLIGLSSVDADVRRNVQLLKERPWLHMPVIYNNGQRALLAMEKGVPGDRVFEEALNAWGQNPPPQR